MTIKTTMHHSKHHRGTDVNRIATVTVSHDYLTASYQATVLLGGGLKACVDTQAEYDANAQAAAIHQFKNDCAEAAGFSLFHVEAGRMYEENGDLYRDSKYCDSFASKEDALAEIKKTGAYRYDYCVINHKGVETQASEVLAETPTTKVYTVVFEDGYVLEEEFAKDEQDLRDFCARSYKDRVIKSITQTH